MTVYEGTVRRVTLDLLMFRLGNDWLGSIWGTGLRWDAPQGRYRRAYLEPTDALYEGSEDQPGQPDPPGWYGTIMQTPARPRYSAAWLFEQDGQAMDGWLFLDQWKTDEVQLYAWTTVNARGDYFDSLVTWLSEHYDHDFRRLELTPEQERQFEHAGGDDERLRIVKEAGYTYWRDVVQQAKLSGNVRQYLSARDISKTNYYRAKRRYRL